MFSIVIPNYNGKKFLKQCLTSIFDAVNPKSQILNSKQIPNSKSEILNIEIIIVDNNSTDGSVEFINSLTSSRVNELRKKKKKKKKNSLITNSLINNRKISIKLIENKKNLGFAAAVNQGILAARNDYVVVMNNDLKVEKNWFEVMAAAIKKYPAKKQKIAAYFGTVLSWDGTKIESMGLKYWIKGKAKNINNGKYFSKLEIRNLKLEIIWGASASVVVYYKPALLGVGLFDEDFFAYEEDVDLALRLWGAGWKTLYIPQAIAYHLGGGTSSKMGNFRQRMDAKNWWFIIVKNYPLPILIKYGPQIFIERLRNLSGLLKATPVWRWIPDVARTYGEVLIKLPRMIRKRKALAALAKRIERGRNAPFGR